MVATYTPGYPPDGSSLGQTKSTIRNNLDGTFDTISVDHVNNNGVTSNGLTSKPAGYHNIIRLVPQSGNPGAIAGYGQLYSKSINSYTTDTALFWETGAGLVQQLTSNLTPSASQNGYTFLPGGIIYQWGVVSSTSSSGTSNFNITFPASVFVVLLTPTVSSSTSHANGMYWNPTGNTNNFKWYQADRADSQTGFSWIAIGN